jgi:fumarylacetoacetate (FAA) hydrolase family protein
LTLPFVHGISRIGLVDEAKVIDFLDSGMCAEILGDSGGVLVSPRHAQAECFQRAEQHPSGVRIGLGAEGAAERADRLHNGAIANHRTRDQVRVTTDILGQRVDGHIRTE